MLRARPLQAAFRDLARLARGETLAHEILRSRLVGVALISIVIDLLCAGAAWGFEGDKGRIDTFWNALFWTTTQLLTVSSNFENPLTTGGKILDVFMELYAIAVVATLAGSFGAFFHHRSEQRRSET